MFVPSSRIMPLRYLLKLPGGTAAPSLWAPRPGADIDQRPRRRVVRAASIEALPKVLLLFRDTHYRASLNLRGVIEESGRGCI
jgi:hypothetical protein